MDTETQIKVGDMVAHRADGGSVGAREVKIVQPELGLMYLASNTPGALLGPVLMDFYQVVETKKGEN